MPGAPFPSLIGREGVSERIAAGLSNTEIARRMSLGRSTVARIRSTAMGKLGADTRAQAVTRWEAAR